VHWAIARLRRMPLYRWTKGQSCTNIQIGPLKWGCSRHGEQNPLLYCRNDVCRGTVMAVGPFLALYVLWLSVNKTLEIVVYKLFRLPSSSTDESEF
jgi:hypothetical protein